ncbi:hypothetical protein [Streptomyces sp. VB1]|uniref:hypothetical protein n=1 Tax=Streptomyces sp. VB1 TaxID=2986803 RepID=UPI002241B6F9|nr:hypothetical protein [Streptomyces sp. VB1]UZI30287.1 hypothetical protein OH133_20400 [Streptomyces sp. VB1]
MADYDVPSLRVAAVKVLGAPYSHRPVLLIPATLWSLESRELRGSWTLRGLSRNRIASSCQLTPGKVSTLISGSQQGRAGAGLA